MTTIAFIVREVTNTIHLTRAIVLSVCVAVLPRSLHAPITRNRNGAFPLEMVRLCNAIGEIWSVSKRCEAFFVYSEYSKAELANNGFPSENDSSSCPDELLEQRSPPVHLGGRN